MFLVLLVQTCGIQRTLRTTAKKVDSLESFTKNSLRGIEKLPTKEETSKMLKNNMYESLVIEEDVDKGVISISEIKKKKLENED